jgi:hypothetical protein
VLPPRRPHRDPQIQIVMAPTSRPSVEMIPIEDASKRGVLFCDVGRWQSEPGDMPSNRGSRILGPRTAIEAGRGRVRGAVDGTVDSMTNIGSQDWLAGSRLRIEVAIDWSFDSPSVDPPSRFRLEVSNSSRC